MFAKSINGYDISNRLVIDLLDLFDYDKLVY